MRQDLSFIAGSYIIIYLVVVCPDQAVDLIIGGHLRVAGVTVSGHSFAGVPVPSEALLIQVNVDSRVQLKDIKEGLKGKLRLGQVYDCEPESRTTFFKSSFVCLK